MNVVPQDIQQVLPAKGFSALLEMFNSANSIGTDDVIAACLPLLQQVADAHGNDRVSPLNHLDSLGLAGGCLFFKADDVQHLRKNTTVTNRKRKTNAALHIVDEVDLVVEESNLVLLGGPKVSASDRRVSEEKSGRPNYLTGYRSWEIENGHHDPLTDIYLLGMLIASLATGLDFHDREQLETFTGARRDLQRLNSRLHPVLVRVIERMTALERFDRAQDMRSLCDALDNYRRIGSDFDHALVPAPQTSEDRETTIIKRLRARLYDTSRRNRLLYHRPIAGELNLTEASVPLVINPDLIRAGDLFTGSSKAVDKLIAGKDLVLGDWIRFEEMLFAPAVLSRLRLDAMRVEQDLGTSPLRLIPAMLHWYDLKNAPDTPITSPLLLLKAKLTKRKGVRDTFVLGIETPEADLNPALAYVLNQLYDIILPEKVDLSKPGAVDNLHEMIKKQVLASEPGVSFSFVDKPKRRLLHTTVRRRLDQFQRRRRGSKGEREGKISDYSYDVKNYKPLGVQLFRQHVRIPEAPFRNIAGRPLPRYFNLPKMSGATQTEKSQVFVQEVAASEGRFDWSFDTSSVVLGNFNYQKMSLLRDYDQLVQNKDLRSPHFSQFFDCKPRTSLPKNELNTEELHNILPSDPSQDHAIAASQNGKSIVLQGPPGTGKSQTIANLISNFASRGKRVLFVCQKRAALDVVRNRLAGTGLADLTAAFHDVKTGRAAFIEELGKLYSSWSDTPPPNTLERLNRDKAGILERLTKARATIETLVKGMSGAGSGAGDDIPLHRLIEQSFSKSAETCSPDSVKALDFLFGALPKASEWELWRNTFEQALPVLHRATDSQNFGDAIEFKLSRRIWQDDSLSIELPKHLEKLEVLLKGKLAKVPDLFEETSSGVTNFLELHDLARYAHALEALNSDLAMVIATGDPRKKSQFVDDVRALEDLARKQEKYARFASAWVLPLELKEAISALAIAQAEEGRFLAKLFSPKLRSIRSLVETRTDTSSHTDKPTVTQLLTWLVEHLKVAEAFDEKSRAFEQRYNNKDPKRLLTGLEIVSDCADAFSTELRALAESLSDASASGLRQQLSDITPQLEEATSLAQALFGDQLRGMKVPELLDAVDQLRAVSSRLPVLAAILRPLATAPDSIWALLAIQEVDVNEIDRLILSAMIEQRFAQHPELEGIDLNLLSLARNQYTEARLDLQKINSEILITRQRNVFRNNLVLSNRSASGLTPDEKTRRDVVLAARRILENEFSKSRAFRSVRDLVQEDCGQIVSTIKPVWMMSPLSVADIIPLQNNFFDVVIFDEASQITVEEALPACVRAQQIVVVGDSKQLPPTKFFSASSRDDDIDDEDHDFELDQESFLTLADEKMPNVMLRWHYRSRREALIAFSNTAFYDTQLLSIPSPALMGPSSEIVVHAGVNSDPDVDTVLGRSLSFHHIPDGIYSARSNEAEADYVARLLRSLLAQQTGKTIGIVAFSEAQQRQIEEAIGRLVEEDKTFAMHLEEEQERTEEGEFVGLFVKNLENVQGDERDIMIISVCYGPGVSRKMRMNFGPINKLGGEKRLNVIFSRARYHMAIVSSITGDEITNDYNTGALALKTMLQFAEASSAGLKADAEHVLNRYRSGFSLNKGKSEGDAAVTTFATRLRSEAGIECDINVGLSDFVIDIVPRLPAEKTLTGKPLAILIDRSVYYETNSVKEVLANRAAILEGAGWEVLTVPLKDIWRKPQEVMSGLQQFIVPAGTTLQ
jgi:AAA domain-containing protein/uncharacterized protein DUF4011